MVSALGDGERCSSHWKSWQHSWAEGVQDVEKETFGSTLKFGGINQVDRTRLEQESGRGDCSVLFMVLIAYSKVRQSAGCAWRLELHDLLRGVQRWSMRVPVVQI